MSQIAKETIYKALIEQKIKIIQEKTILLCLVIILFLISIGFKSVVLFGVAVGLSFIDMVVLKTKIDRIDLFIINNKLGDGDGNNNRSPGI